MERRVSFEKLGQHLFIGNIKINHYRTESHFSVQNFVLGLARITLRSLPQITDSFTSDSENNFTFLLTP